jgi:hypothetical protein
MATRRLRLSFLLAPITCFAACGGGGAPSGPRIDVDASSCEARLETLLTLKEASAGSLDIRAIAVGDDGTVYFNRLAVPRETAGVYAIRQGKGDPIQIAPASDDLDLADRMWVDGSTLLFATVGRLFTLPTSGGTPSLVSQIPLQQPASDGLLVDAYGLDATSLYVGATYNAFTSPRFELYRLPRAGGDAVLVASSADPAFNFAWAASIQLDVTNVYLAATAGKIDGPLMRVPKTGGAFAVSLPEVEVGLSQSLVLSGTDFYSADLAGGITRYPADPSAAPVAIGGLDVHYAGASGLIGDASGVYAGLIIDPSHVRAALAAVPAGDERTTLLGCTPPAAAGDNGYGVLAMAMDATHLYALAADFDTHEWAIWRVAR